MPRSGSGSYRGQIDSPKTNNSHRKAALAEGLIEDIRAWKDIARDASPEGWVFPSEKDNKPLWKDNVWRRHIQPRLHAIGLGWVDFHVTRRTHATLMNEVNDDPKLPSFHSSKSSFGISHPTAPGRLALTRGERCKTYTPEVCSGMTLVGMAGWSPPTPV